MRRRGIFLITTMQVIGFVVMLVAAMVFATTQGLTTVGTYNERELALQAARIGATWLQARLESGVSRYDAGVPSLDRTITGTGIRIVERGRTVIGEIDNGSVPGKRIRAFFRATFGSSPTTFVAEDNQEEVVGNCTVPRSRFVSCSNLTKDRTFVAYSFDESGARHQEVPGNTVDLVVDGFAVRDDGIIRARRTFEVMLGIAALGDLAPAAVIAADDIQLTLKDAGGRITVGLDPSSGLSDSQMAHGLVSGNRIRITGKDPLVSDSKAPPGYTQDLKSNVPSGGGDLSYRQEGGLDTAPGRFSELFDTLGIRPPEIDEGNLPALRNGAGQLKPGTWVVWSGKVLHYPVALSGGAAFAGGTGDTPPTLGGQGPSSETLPAGVTLDPSMQQLVVGDVDLHVKPLGSLSGVSMVTAPAVNQPAGANPAAVQLVFAPSSGELTPQLRSSGPITVAGNVLGRGSLITVGASGGHITIQGKSQIDPGSDSGVALYSTGDVRIKPLDPQQLPVALGGSPAEAPPGNPQFQALAQALNTAPVSGRGSNIGSFNRYLAGSDVILELDPVDASDPSTGTVIQDVPVTVVVGGRTISGPLAEVLPRLPTETSSLDGYDEEDDGEDGEGTGRASVAEINQLLARFVGGANDSRAANGFSPYTRVTTADQSYVVSASTFANWYTYGALAQPTPSVLPKPPVALPAGATPYDQEFGGLVYARGGFMIPDAENFRLNGSMVTLDGGVEIRAKSLDFRYSPSRIGNFAGFFGGRVTLAAKFSSSL